MIPNANIKPACLYPAREQLLWSGRTGAIPEKGFQEEGGPAENAAGCLDTGRADRLLREAGMQNLGY